MTAKNFRISSGEELIRSLFIHSFYRVLKSARPAQTRFYEHECIRGEWSVRELKRQVARTLYF